MTSRIIFRCKRRSRKVLCKGGGAGVGLKTRVWVWVWPGAIVGAGVVPGARRGTGVGPLARVLAGVRPGVIVGAGVVPGTRRGTGVGTLVRVRAGVVPGTRRGTGVGPLVRVRSGKGPIRGKYVWCVAHISLEVHCKIIFIFFSFFTLHRTGKGKNARKVEDMAQ